MLHVLTIVCSICLIPKVSKVSGFRNNGCGFPSRSLVMLTTKKKMSSSPSENRDSTAGLHIWGEGHACFLVVPVLKIKKAET